MTTTRLSSADGPPLLHWDGQHLHGPAQGKIVTVAVPARFLAFRREDLPPAPTPALKAAARLKAERAFATLGPVVVEALLPPPRDGRCAALLLALPVSVLEAIRQAAQSQGRQLAAVRVAELLVPVPTGGLVQVAGECCLVAMDGRDVRAIAALSPASAPDHARLLARERLRLGLAEDAPAGDPCGQNLDFLHPTLAAAQPFLARRGMRPALLVAGLSLLLLLALGLLIHDTVATRDAAQAEAAKLRPLATALAEKRGDLKEVASWFSARPSLTPGLAALARALPSARSEDRVHLVRVRQAMGEESVAEGVAAHQTHMLAFLTRLREDPSIASAEIRAFRNPSKGASEVVFELAFRIKASAAGIISSKVMEVPDEKS